MPFSRALMATIGVLALYSAKIDAEESILIIRCTGKEFEDVTKGIIEELGDSVAVKQVLVNNQSTADSIKTAIARYSPKMAVLMDNKAINLFKDYQRNLPDSAAVIPSMSLMAVMIEKAIADLKNSAGISYEIPIVTSAVDLRAVVKKPLRKIGVIHREFMSDFVRWNAGYCRKEGIELITVVLPNKSFFSYSFRIRNGLKRLFGKENVDALWVPNDNALLTPDLIADYWAPAINEYGKPAIVGVEALVNPMINMGAFAVLPDHRSLGNQAAGFILDVKDYGWRIKEHKVFPPISVHKAVNAVQMKKFFNIDVRNIENVDKIMQ